MRMLINGKEGHSIEIVQAGQGPALKVQFLEDDGGLVDLDGAAATLEFYTSKDRTGTPVSMAITLGGTTDSAGYGIITPTVAQTTTLTKGLNYVFGKTVVATVARFAAMPSVAAVG